MAYLHSEAIIIDHTKCGATDSSSFPMVFNSTIATLKTVGNGGEVFNSNGYDIIFSSTEGDFLGLNKLDHEIETYTSTTGAIVFWVRIPTLSHTVDTKIYLYWGNPLISTSQENITGVWDTNYKAVWHMNNIPTSGSATIVDSTSNANIGTPGGTWSSGQQIPGQIGGSLNFDGTTDYVKASVASGGSLDLAAPVTMEAWFYASGTGTQMTIFNEGVSGSKGYRITANSGHANVGLMGGGNFSATASYSANTWQHVVGIENGASSKIYINGALDNSGTLTINAPTIFPTQYVIGSETSLSTSLFSGQLDEIRVSNVARSADWILSSYNNQNSPSTFYSFGSEESTSNNFLLLGIS